MRHRKPKPRTSVKKVETNPHESKASDKEAQPQNHSPVPLAASVRVRQIETPKPVDGAASSNSKTEQPKQRSNERWMTRFTGLIFLVTAIYAGVSVFQLRAINRQGDLMAKQLESVNIGERAYIGINSIQISPLVVGQQPFIDVVFVNGGRTPASHFIAQGRIYTKDKKLTSPLWNTTTPYAGVGSFLISGKTQATTFYAGWNLTNDTLSKIQATDSKWRLFVETEAHYIDSMGRDQVFTYCAVYHPAENALAECD
ncbi:MAG: hypothetical protein ABR577_04500 [Pyrinomonadaceae bacterium]